MVDEVTASEDTIWPQGFDPVATGVIFVQAARRRETTRTSANC
jgi:hypothetical protein